MTLQEPAAASLRSNVPLPKADVLSKAKPDPVIWGWNGLVNLTVAPDANPEPEILSNDVSGHAPALGGDISITVGATLTMEDVTNPDVATDNE